ncbi:predicted protein [Uncinocarpus reesii 1704]|uniref:Uncharacterized protein n=1 Tax=Uncinocarpus reesii (strain UAMH 1704) TaxID=336963 RepID=C4JJE3_UNCRE|nr:uncharacterized protein UREG_01750 [Uncinocarpus reesii 1704]EEP76901.1 predicted protein [Uncinocarpus reesii 1704]
MDEGNVCKRSGGKRSSNSFRLRGSESYTWRRPVNEHSADPETTNPDLCWESEKRDKILFVALSS